jgi:hypothetical protein
MKRAHLLGSWACPSGNSVDAYDCPRSTDLAIIRLEWDAPPPLTSSDEGYYRTTIRPALIARVRGYLEVVQRGSMAIEP